jgi:hypothetical protein
VYAKTGDLGGWIESEGNLSETRDAWVAGEAQVYGAARVSDNALVFGSAIVMTRISGNARVGDKAIQTVDLSVENNVRSYTK